MAEIHSYYIGHLKLDVNPQAYLVKVSFVEEPPCQNGLRDLPEWTLGSRNAIWFMQEDLPYNSRAVNGDKIKEELLLQFIQ